MSSITAGTLRRHRWLLNKQHYEWNLFFLDLKVARSFFLCTFTVFLHVEKSCASTLLRSRPCDYLSHQDIFVAMKRAKLLPRTEILWTIEDTDVTKSSSSWRNASTSRSNQHFRSIRNHSSQHTHVSCYILRETLQTALIVSPEKWKCRDSIYRSWSWSDSLPFTCSIALSDRLEIMRNGETLPITRLCLIDTGCGKQWITEQTEPLVHECLQIITAARLSKHESLILFGYCLKKCVSNE